MSTPAPEGSPVGDTITVPVTPTPETTPVPDARFTAADIERIRKEEKDKLYGRLEETRKAQEQLLAEVEALKGAKKSEVDAAAAQARKEAEEAARKRWEESEAKDLIASVQSEWEQKFQNLEREREQERLLFQKEQEFSQLQNFVQKRVSEETAAGNIAPELVDLVSGNTPDEVESSLNILKAKTQAILESVQQAQVAARAQMRGVSSAGYAASGPMDTTSGTQTYSASDISGMSMAEYAKVRGSLLGAASAQQQNRGLYG